MCPSTEGFNGTCSMVNFDADPFLKQCLFFNVQTPRQKENKWMRNKCKSVFKLWKKKPYKKGKKGNFVISKERKWKQKFNWRYIFSTTIRWASREVSDTSRHSNDSQRTRTKGTDVTHYIGVSSVTETCTLLGKQINGRLYLVRGLVILHHLLFLYSRSSSSTSWDEPGIISWNQWVNPFTTICDNSQYEKWRMKCL